MRSHALACSEHWWTLECWPIATAPTAGIFHESPDDEPPEGSGVVVFVRADRHRLLCTTIAGNAERARRRVFAVSPASGPPKRNGVTRTTRTSFRAFVGRASSASLSTYQRDRLVEREFGAAVQPANVEMMPWSLDTIPRGLGELAQPVGVRSRSARRSCDHRIRRYDIGPSFGTPLIR